MFSNTVVWMSDAPENLRYAGRVHLHVVALTTVLAVELCRAGGYPVRITVVYRAIFTCFGIHGALAGNSMERSRGIPFPIYRSTFFGVFRTLRHTSRESQ